MALQDPICTDFSVPLHPQVRKSVGHLIITTTGCALTERIRLKLILDEYLYEMTAVTKNKFRADSRNRIFWLV